jgi:anti-anti-sigma factor
MTTLTEVPVRQIRNVTIVAPEGRMRHDTPMPDSFYASVRRALEEGRIRILVDFSAVTTIDATGVARLTRALTSTCNAGGSLKLMRVSPLVYDVLEIIRLHESFEIFEDESEAIRSFE